MFASRWSEAGAVEREGGLMNDVEIGRVLVADHDDEHRAAGACADGRGDRLGSGPARS